MNEPVIIDAVRTAYGKRRGAYRDIRPDSLLADTVNAVLKKSGVESEYIEDLIVGCVSQAGEQAANVGRIAALLAGLPSSVPGVSLNRMCGSSQQAVHFAAQAVASGDARYVIAGGVESMTRVPMFLDVTLGQHDFRGFDDLNPALLQRYPLVHQLESAERIAEHWGITRSDCDAFAKESHRRAYAAAAAGRHREIVPSAGIDADGKPIIVTRDEGIRASIDDAKMASMAPAMRAPGRRGGHCGEREPDVGWRIGSLDWRPRCRNCRRADAARKVSGTGCGRVGPGDAIDGRHTGDPQGAEACGALSV
jgi:acetyl-CoA acyltransferase